MLKYEILEKTLANIDNRSSDYIDAIDKRVSDFIDYTQLPRVYQQNGLDVRMLPQKIKSLLLDLFDVVEKPLNKLILLPTYKESGYIAAMLMKQYVINCFIRDMHIPSMLYIDTNLLIEDYKKYMNITNNNLDNTILVHSTDVLFKEILTADYVFWDKFTLVDSSYATSKLYDILSIRYRQCLGNMFFITGGVEAIKDLYNVEMLNVMNLSDPILDLQNDKFLHTQDKE